MRSFFLVLAATAALSSVGRGQPDARVTLEHRFAQTVRPFFNTYCITCHGQQQPGAAQMDLSRFTAMAALMNDGRRRGQILERFGAGEMPRERPSRRVPAGGRPRQTLTSHPVYE